jgi:hypothetical protein
MEINSANLKFEAVSAASNEGLLQSAVKPADPRGRMGAPKAIFINERRWSAVGFGIFGKFFLYGFVQQKKGMKLIHS